MHLRIMELNHDLLSCTEQGFFSRNKELLNFSILIKRFQPESFSVIAPVKNIINRLKPTKTAGKSLIFSCFHPSSYRMQQPQRTATQVDKKGLIVSAAYDSGVITPEIHIIDIKFAETRIHFERYLRVNS